MAQYGLVAGKDATEVMEEQLQSFTDIDFTYKPLTMTKMIDDLASTGGIIVRDLKSILILDYAFENSETEAIAEDFVAIQDLMHTNSLSNVTLYLLTRNSDLYKMLQGSIQGLSGTHFEGTQIFLIRQEYTVKLLQSVLLGERDNQGLYNQEAWTRKTKEQRLREDMEAEVENRRNLNQEYLEFDKTDPVSVISQGEYLDSAKRQQLDAEKKKQQEEEIRRQQREARRNKQKRELDKKQYIQEQKPKILIEKTDTIQNHPFKQHTTVGTTENQKLKEIFRNMKDTRTSLTAGKLESDKGILSVVSDYSSGGSGFVANTADMYAIAGRKVLVIDLDIESRSQTLYFNQYDKAVKEQKGISESLIEVVQGFDIKDTVVPVSKYVDILSVSRGEEIKKSWADAIGGALEGILIEARKLYDVVILDIPFRLFAKYIKHLEEVNRNIFVVENTFYKIETFIENSVHPFLIDPEYEEYVENFIRKSTIVLNKFIRGRRDKEGNEINRHYLREVVDVIGYPYDRMGVLGEVPFYENWEEQYFTGVRQVWKDTLALGVYKNIYGKVVI